MFRCCLDKRVIGSVAIVGVAVLVLAPQLIGTVLPLLLIAVCPISMMLMGWVMLRRPKESSAGSTAGSKFSAPSDVPYDQRSSTDPAGQIASLRRQLEQLEERYAGRVH